MLRASLRGTDGGGLGRLVLHLNLRGRRPPGGLAGRRGLLHRRLLALLILGELHAVDAVLHIGEAPEGESTLGH